VKQALRVKNFDVRVTSASEMMLKPTMWTARYMVLKRQFPTDFRNL
jgi:hypothetical protein